MVKYIYGVHFFYFSVKKKYNVNNTFWCSFIPVETFRISKIVYFLILNRNYACYVRLCLYVIRLWSRNTEVREPVTVKIKAALLPDALKKKTFINLIREKVAILIHVSWIFLNFSIHLPMPLGQSTRHSSQAEELPKRKRPSTIEQSRAKARACTFWKLAKKSAKFYLHVAQNFVYVSQIW